MPARITIYVVIVAFILIASGHDTYAQSLDSINHKIDSVQSKVGNIVNPNFNDFTSKLQRTKLEVNDTIRATHELDSMKRGLNYKIDSLRKIGLPTDRYTRKLDSLNKISPRKYIDAANRRVQSLDDKVNDKLDLMRNEGGANANLPGNLDTNLPKTDIGNPLNSIDKPSVDNPLTKIDNPIANQGGQLNELKDKVGDIKSAPQEQINKVKSIDEIKDAQEKLGDVNKVTDKVQSYQNEVKNIANKEVDASEIEKGIENKAGEISEVKELQKQTGEMGKANEMIKANNPDALKEQAKQEVMKQAVDHFKGKEEALKGAMDKLSKLKQKYNDVPSIKDLPKRAPNPMKSKPLIERIVPGFTMQLQNSGYFLLDINPVVSYRFTGRINAGFGWNERLAFSKWNKLSGNERIYGPRVFGSFGFKKGFSVKAEIEKMNALVPVSLASSDRSRAWVWSAFVGMKKDYKFIGSVRGNVQMLYNVYDDHDNSPYFDRFVVRMGFEFPLKKAKKPVEIRTSM